MLKTKKKEMLPVKSNRKKHNVNLKKKYALQVKFPQNSSEQTKQDEIDYFRSLNAIKSRQNLGLG